MIFQNADGVRSRIAALYSFESLLNNESRVDVQEYCRRPEIRNILNRLQENQATVFWPRKNSESIERVKMGRICDNVYDIKIFFEDGKSDRSFEVF